MGESERAAIGEKLKSEAEIERKAMPFALSKVDEDYLLQVLSWWDKNLTLKKELGLIPADVKLSDLPDSEIPKFAEIILKRL